MRKTKKYSRKIFLILIGAALLGWEVFVDAPKISAETVVQHIEAESGQINSPMKVINNNLGVSGYIQTSELIGGCNNSYPSGSAVFNIAAPEAGFYKMRANALALWDNNDSFYFKIDDLPTDNYNRGYVWDLYNVYLPEGSPYNPSSLDWRIQDVRARDNNDNSLEYFSAGYPYEFYLSAGNHKITFYGREYTDIQKYTDPNYRCSSATGELTAKLDWFELVRVDDAAQTAKKWEFYEIRLLSGNQYNNAYAEDVIVTATFNHPTTDKLIIVNGFWNGKNFDGKDKFIVRFTPTEEGVWDYNITNNKNDAGLNKTGSFNVSAADSGNHGFVRVDKDNPVSFVYDDGARYLMFGTTAYNIMDNALDKNQRGHWKESVDYFASHGINKIRFSLFPFSAKFIGANEYEDHLPFETNTVDLLNPTRDEILVGYWQQAEELVKYMGSKGIIADIILFTNEERSFGPDAVSGDAQDDRYVRYAVNRFAAYPNVIWDLANEWDYRVMNNGSVERAREEARKISVARWSQIGNIVKNEDPWYVSKNGQKRPLSIHEGDPSYTPGMFDFFDSGWATYAILQVAPNTVDGDDASKSAFLNLAPYTFNPELNVYGNSTKPEELGNFSILPDLNHGMPVVNDEYGYVADDFDRDMNRKAIWGIYTAGGYASMGDSHTWDGRAFKCNKSDLWARGNKNFKTGNYYGGDSTSRYPDGCGTNMGEAYNDVKRLVDFFTAKGIEYWKMRSDNALVNAWNLKHVYTLANPGQEYVVYDAAGNSFNINLDVGKTYNITRYNPRTGEETQLAQLPGGVQEIISSDANATTVFKEAEEANTLTSPMITVNDLTASGGSYIKSTQTNAAGAGTAEYAVNIPTSGEHKILTKVRTHDGNSDSFFVQVDGNPRITWYVGTTTANQDKWNEVIVTTSENGPGYEFDVQPGIHTIKFIGREANAQLDYFYVLPINAQISSGNDWVYHIKAINSGTSADVNGDGFADITDIQLCVNVILGMGTDPAIAARAKAVAVPLDNCDVMDLQMIVNEILAGT